MNEVYTIDEPLILSIDVGLNNIGVILHDPITGHVVDWFVKCLPITTFNPESVVNAVDTFFKSFLNEKSDYPVIIERQIKGSNTEK